MTEIISVQYLDPDGVMRVWASGQIQDEESYAITRVETEDLAAAELAIYRKEKLMSNDPLAAAEFTRVTEIYDDETEEFRTITDERSE
jgi:hypothetical protein